MSENAMDAPIVPPPPPRSIAARPNGVYVALPLITLAWLVLFGIVAMSAFRIERYELAPGDALAVAPRIEFAATEGQSDVPERYPNDEGMHFVTALGGQLSILDAVLGWIDPHVQVDTYEERFGDQTPEQNREIGFQSMVTSKQLAQFVALRAVGIEAELVDGVVQIAAVVCDGAPEENSACENLEVGDVIVAVNGNETATLPALLAELAKPEYTVGQVVTVTVVSDGNAGSQIDPSQTVDVPIQLMASDDGTRAIIGIVPADTRQLSLPFDVRISTTDIGGPSAGLAFTLALLDELTEGDLMGKGKVAATGTIRQDGSVGAIGALEQKAVAVRQSGIGLFLVPSEQSDDEIERARKAAGSSVRIVAVSTLDEALEALLANGGDPLPRR